MISFLRQQDEPLFPKLFWSRPTTRQAAGKLVIVGGRSGDFGSAQSAYQLSLAAGSGDTVAVLPDSLRALLAAMPAARFVASSPQGGIAHEAVREINHLASDARGILIGPNLGTDSQVTMMEEQLLDQTKAATITTFEAVSAIKHHPGLIAENSGRVAVLSVPELVKWAGHLGIALRMRQDEGAVTQTDLVSQVSTVVKCGLLVYGYNLISAVGDRICLTPSAGMTDRLPAAAWAAAAVFTMQNQSQLFEALTSAAYILRQTEKLLDARQTVHTTETAAKAMKEALEKES